ncbi:hypothetical protein AAW14_24035 [Streptomyces hygroscopicus]|uniref:hypothetical protein n=1 Tax=Streptomyces hygroscopicus TaxID=1912 RepID=UPI00224005EF|nr:hypothetical protein [Streptomyces hygroscopicus]MCW7945000.1 hypothetical protein [Streptomyces hygroscopicus]
MTIPTHTELVHHFTEDFTSLQDAVLARMNGICASGTAAALEHSSLAGPSAIAFAHADVLARGDVRRAELSAQPAERLRPLREHARKVRRARSQADAVCKEQRARRVADLSMPVEKLKRRVVRAAYPEPYAQALRNEFRDRGLPEGTPQAPDSDFTRWAWNKKRQARNCGRAGISGA